MEDIKDIENHAIAKYGKIKDFIKSNMTAEEWFVTGYIKGTYRERGNRALRDIIDFANDYPDLFEIAKREEKELWDKLYQKLFRNSVLDNNK